MLLRARVVVPVSQPPIDNGAVLISGRRIRAVGAWRDLARTSKQKAIDLGEVALLPGLINACRSLRERGRKPGPGPSPGAGCPGNDDRAGVDGQGLRLID